MAVRDTWEDFKKFALKGNLVDLAVAVVIGAAFGKVVDAFVKHLLMPALSYLTPDDGGGLGYRAWKVGRIEVGAFLGEVINFLIIALALYLVLNKLLGTIVARALPSPPGEPTIKECPLCLSSIPFKATRCAHCAADLPAEATTIGADISS